MRLLKFTASVFILLLSLAQASGQISKELPTNQHAGATLATDTMTAGHSGHQSVEPKESNWILHHIADSHELDLEPFGTVHLPQFAPVNMFGLTIDLSITKHVVFLWVVGVFLILLLGVVARLNRSHGIPRGLGNLIEVLIVFIRDEVVLPTIGKEGLRLMPFFLTIFFFILLCNLIGLVPYGSTATGNISVTATLAIISFIVIQAAGIVENGFVGYFRGLIPPGVPVFVLPVMIVVELIGLFTKPFALCIRLFANMTAGHIVILSLISLIFLFRSVAVAPVSIAFALFINLLEIFIALLQAYIFTMLSALFVSLAVHQEH
jgi:F-type H+-transporting ATPase subunit a